MTVTKLTESNQANFILGGGPAQRGICYYICNYLDEHPKSPWKKPKNFAEARIGVTRMCTIPLVNAGKAFNLRKTAQGAGYNDPSPLSDNSIFRVELEVDTGGINHETMMLTGSGELILFDPNYGFYHIDTIAGRTYHTAFENQLGLLYNQTPLGSFGYKRKRKAFSS